MPDDRVRFTLRIPKELHEKIGAVASRQGWSRNQAVVHGLRAWLYSMDEPRLVPVGLAEQLEKANFKPGGWVIVDEDF